MDAMQKQVTEVNQGKELNKTPDTSNSSGQNYDICSFHDMIDRDRHDGNQRWQQISHAMSPHDLPSAAAFGSCQKNVFLPRFLHEFVSEHIGVVPQMAQDHDG